MAGNIKIGLQISRLNQLLEVIFHGPDSKAVPFFRNNQDELLDGFNEFTDDDKQTGFIYILSSLSKDERIYTIKNLFKIGYASNSVQERIKNAEKDPTYLMAPVKIEASYQCFNMKPQKLENLLHRFFGKSCLNLDIYDDKGKRHTPREWFIAPLPVIEHAIAFIINGKIVKMYYDAEKEAIRYLKS